MTTHVQASALIAKPACSSVKRMIGARATFCAAHKLPQHPELHGHSYEVWAYTVSGCVEAWQQTLKNAVAELDHKTLHPDLSTMEDIAIWIGNKTGAVKVKVIRPVEGLCAEIDLPLSYWSDRQQMTSEIE